MHRPLSDYALIGNTHSAALIAPDGAVDWCCLPHFDSPAAFCRLLDAQRGGYLQLGAACPTRARRRYLDRTGVLETDLEADCGHLRIIDFMHSPPIAQSRLGLEDPHCHRLLRRIECVNGTVPLELSFKPTFDFAREAARFEAVPGGIDAASSRERLRLRLDPPPRMEVRGDTAAARFDLRAGQRCWMTLSHAGAGSGDASLRRTDPAQLLEETYRHRHEWSALCDYAGPYEEQVHASARVLKLLTFSPTGALVAAPTASLPEEIGGLRNWDYRFCWLRDSALVLRALMAIGHRRAALDFFVWLEGLCELGGDPGCDGLQIVHRLDGGRDMPEVELPHLAGYRGSRPVRTGNGAARQLQLDVYGHVLDAALVCLREMALPLRPGLVRVLRHFADMAASRWREPDQGLWETRRDPQHHVSSKLMCWVALDRAVRMADAGWIGGGVDAWRREREAVRELILRDGYNGKAGAFTQVVGGRGLDASVLMMPLVGFIDARDERMRSTVERVQQELTAHGLVFRYREHDGVSGDEGTFAMCSYWLVQNLAQQGRLDKARRLFERIGTYASDLGLMSEEIDARNGMLLGNYPQGFTHLALIDAALAIEQATPVGGLATNRRIAAM
jgi:GH15 family glucan-1,4-alpha-glucosidase